MSPTLAWQLSKQLICSNNWLYTLTSERQTETEQQTDCSNLKPFTVFIQIWLPLCTVLVNALGFEQLHARDLLYIRIIETCCFSAYFQVQWCNMDFKIKFTLLLNILHLWTVQTYFVSSMLSDSFSLPKSALSVKCNTKKSGSLSKLVQKLLKTKQKARICHSIYCFQKHNDNNN